MALKFNCPYCGHKNYVQYLKIGDVALCRHCGQKREIPAAAQEVDIIPKTRNVDWEKHDQELDFIHVSKESFEHINALEARPLDSLATSTSILLWFTAVLLFLLLISTLLQYFFYLDIKNGNIADLYARTTSNDARQALISLLYTLTFAISAITFFIWFYRAHKNLKYAKVPGKRHASGWTIGGFLVPIMNLFRPYQMMAETWRGSAAMSGTYSYEELIDKTTSMKIRLWWASVILAVPINFIASKLSKDADGVEDLIKVATFNMFGQALYIIYFILLIYVIREITRHQSNARKIALVRSTS